MLLFFYFHALVGIVILPQTHVNLITPCHIDTPSPYTTILIVITPHCHGNRVPCHQYEYESGRLPESSEAENYARCVLQGRPCHATSAT